MYMGSNGLRSRSETPDLNSDNMSDRGSIASDRRGPRVCLLLQTVYKTVGAADNV